MDQDLTDMLRISKAVGGDERLVQGGGGNTSVKTQAGDLMYVKASGTSLADMSEGRGYRQVDVEKCLRVVEDKDLLELRPADREAEVLRRLCESCVDQLDGRPSVETGLHAMLGRYVVHTHPSVVNGLLCAAKGREKLAELFADFAPPYLYVEYVNPGYSLATRLYTELANHRRRYGGPPEVMFLENHGLFVTADKADRALSLTKEVFGAIEGAVRKAREKAALPPFSPLSAGQQEAMAAQVAAAMRPFYSAVLGRPALIRFDNEKAVTEFLRIPRARDLSKAPPMIPDQVVYCGGRPIWVEPHERETSVEREVISALKEVEAGADTPFCILLKGLGLFSAAPSAKLLDAASSVMQAVLETLSVAFHFGGPRGLSSEAIESLRDCEADRFRRGLAAG